MDEKDIIDVFEKFCKEKEEDIFYVQEMISKMRSLLASLKHLRRFDLDKRRKIYVRFDGDDFNRHISDNQAMSAKMVELMREVVLSEVETLRDKMMRAGLTTDPQ